MATPASLGKSADGKDIKDMADAAFADPANVKRVLDAAVPAPEFYFAKYLPKDPVTGVINTIALGTHEGVHNLRMILTKLRNIASPVVREHWMKELSRRTGVSEKTLQEESAKATGSAFALQATPTNAERAAEAASAEAGPKRQLTRYELICEKLLSAALAKDDVKTLDECVEFLAPVYKEMFRILKSGKRTSQDPGLDAALNDIVLRSGSGPGDGETLDGEIAALKAELSKEYYKERRKIISQAIKNAEARGNDTELAAALEELRNLPASVE